MGDMERMFNKAMRDVGNNFTSAFSFKNLFSVGMLFTIIMGIIVLIFIVAYRIVKFVAVMLARIFNSLMDKVSANH